MDENPLEQFEIDGLTGFLEAALTTLLQRRYPTFDPNDVTVMGVLTDGWVVPLMPPEKLSSLEPVLVELDELMIGLHIGYDADTRMLVVRLGSEAQAESPSRRSVVDFRQRVIEIETVRGTPRPSPIKTVVEEVTIEDQKKRDEVPRKGPSVSDLLEFDDHAEED